MPLDYRVSEETVAGVLHGQRADVVHFSKLHQEIYVATDVLGVSVKVQHYAFFGLRLLLFIFLFLLLLFIFFDNNGPFALFV